MFDAHPAALQMVDVYLMQIDTAIAQATMGILDAGGEMIPTQTAVPGKGGTGGQTAPGPAGLPAAQGNAPGQQGAHGRAQQMGNSNQNAAGAGPTSSSPAGTGSRPNAISMAQQGRASAYLNKPGGGQ